jgi:hypothetical protein
MANRIGEIKCDVVEFCESHTERTRNIAQNISFRIFYSIDVQVFRELLIAEISFCFLCIRHVAGIIQTILVGWRTVISRNYD